MNPSQIEILSVLKRRPKTGLTRREIEGKTGRRSGTVCARVSELLYMGKIKRNGKRYDYGTRKNVEVLVVV